MSLYDKEVFEAFQERDKKYMEQRAKDQLALKLGQQMLKVIHEVLNGKHKGASEIIFPISVDEVVAHYDNAKAFVRWSVTCKNEITATQGRVATAEFDDIEIQNRHGVWNPEKKEIEWSEWE